MMFYIWYYFEFEFDLVLFGKIFMLCYIEDVNGNCIDFYYIKDVVIDFCVKDLFLDFFDDLDEDVMIVDVIKDGVNWVFVLSY